MNSCFLPVEEKAWKERSKEATGEKQGIVG